MVFDMPIMLRRKPIELGQTLNNVLKDLEEKVKDVDGALIIRSDGLVVASRIRESLDRDLVAAMSASLLNVSMRVLEELQKGKVEDLVVKGNDGLIAVMLASQDVVIATMAKKDVNLGLLLLGMRKAKDKILRVLEEG